MTFDEAFEKAAFAAMGSRNLEDCERWAKWASSSHPALRFRAKRIAHEVDPPAHWLRIFSKDGRPILGEVMIFPNLDDDLKRSHRGSVIWFGTVKNIKTGSEKLFFGSSGEADIDDQINAAIDRL